MFDILDQEEEEEEEEERALKRRKAAALHFYLQSLKGSKPRWTVEGRCPNKYASDVQRLQLIEIAEMKESNPKRFTRMFRLHPVDFDELLRKITPELNNGKTYYNSVSPVVKLICTLRYLAGGLYTDICFCWKVNEYSFYHFVEECLQAIDKALKNIRFPVAQNCVDEQQQMKELREMELKFARLSFGHIRGTVAAVDGIVFRMERPSKSEVDNNVRGYFVRKGYYAFGMQGMCDADCKFVSISSLLTSSSHDSTAYQLSAFADAIRNGQLPSNFHVVMDEAYPCREQEMSPWSGKGLSVEKDAFNFLLSRQRQCIERAFGLLVGRFGIFWRPLRMKLSKIPLVVRVCCKLHNICVDRFTAAASVETYRNNMRDTDHQKGDDYEPVWNNDTGKYRGYRTDLESCPKRERVTHNIRILGYERPSTSSFSRVSKHKRRTLLNIDI